MKAPQQPRQLCLDEAVSTRDRYYRVSLRYKLCSFFPDLKITSFHLLFRAMGVGAETEPRPQSNSPASESGVLRQGLTAGSCGATLSTCGTPLWHVMMSPLVSGLQVLKQN